MSALDDRIATPAGKRRYVRSLFATIADRYDHHRPLSYGQDGDGNGVSWIARCRTQRSRADLATNGRDIGRTAARGPMSSALTSHRMIEQPKSSGRTQIHEAARAAFLVGDPQSLLFPDSSSDVVTTGWVAERADLTVAIDDSARPGRRAGPVVGFQPARQRPRPASPRFDSRRRRWAGCCIVIRIRIDTFRRRALVRARKPWR